MLADPKSEDSTQPDYIKSSGAARARNPEYWVGLAVCTHLGCSPLGAFEANNAFQVAGADLGANWPGGFYCPCHGSKYDLSGRVFKSMPAPKNLTVPPYAFANAAAHRHRRRRRRQDSLAQEVYAMAAAPESAGSGKGLIGWIDQRFPLTKLWKDHVAEYYAPKNFNFWYYFGSLALLILVNQLVTGIFLTMNYKPSSAEAFSSIEYIMRDVDWGWLIRYMHSTGASAFFIVVYLHMFRALLYGSHRKPRELVWIFGCLIFLLLMAEALHGLRAALGQHELLGRAGHRVAVRQPAGHRAGAWSSGSAATTTSPTPP